MSITSSPSNQREFKLHNKMSGAMIVVITLVILRLHAVTKFPVGFSKEYSLGKDEGKSKRGP